MFVKYCYTILTFKEILKLIKFNSLKVTEGKLILLCFKIAQWFHFISFYHPTPLLCNRWDLFKKREWELKFFLFNAIKMFFKIFNAVLLFIVAQIPLLFLIQLEKRSKNRFCHKWHLIPLFIQVENLGLSRSRGSFVLQISYILQSFIWNK